jgi:hypothetical protein
MATSRFGFNFGDAKLASPNMETYARGQLTFSQLANGTQSLCDLEEVLPSNVE